MEKGNPDTKAAQAVPAKYPAPVIVDLGSQSKKAINKLKAGRGKLYEEVGEGIEQAHRSLPEADKNKQIIVVLVIFKKKRRRGLALRSPISALNPLNFLC